MHINDDGGHLHSAGIDLLADKYLAYINRKSTLQFQSLWDGLGKGIITSTSTYCNEHKAGQDKKCYYIVTSFSLFCMVIVTILVMMIMGYKYSYITSI